MAKVLFFGAYVVAVSRVPGLDLVTFGASFFVYFVALYIVQAFLIRGLVCRRPPDAVDDSSWMSKVRFPPISTPPPTRAEGFNAGELIIGHVANSGLDHPLLHLPPVFGIDFSITKHVFMLWVVAVAAVCRHYGARPRLPAEGRRRPGRRR